MLTEYYQPLYLHLDRLQKLSSHSRKLVKLQVCCAANAKTKRSLCCTTGSKAKERGVKAKLKQEKAWTDKGGKNKGKGGQDYGKNSGKPKSKGKGKPGNTQQPYLPSWTSWWA